MLAPQSEQVVVEFNILTISSKRYFLSFQEKSPRLRYSMRQNVFVEEQFQCVYPVSPDPVFRPQNSAKMQFSRVIFNSISQPRNHPMHYPRWMRPVRRVQSRASHYRPPSWATERAPRETTFARKKTLFRNYQTSKIPLSKIDESQLFCRNSETIIHILKGNIGIGVLTLPMALRNSGLIAGSLGLVIIASVCVYCMVMLVRAAHKVRETPFNIKTRTSWNTSFPSQSNNALICLCFKLDFQVLLKIRTGVTKVVCSLGFRSSKPCELLGLRRHSRGVVYRCWRTLGFLGTPHKVFIRWNSV